MVYSVKYVATSDMNFFVWEVFKVVANFKKRCIFLSVS